MHIRKETAEANVSFVMPVCPQCHSDSH